MAIMVPPVIDDDAPQSEQIVFQVLSKAPLAREWVIYHSLHVTNPRNSTRPREIDFLILIPDLCTLICVEAKGGSFRIDRDRRWRNASSGEPVDPSPPRQCVKSMFALKDQLKAHFGAGSPLLIGCAVVFTYAEPPKGAKLEPTPAHLVWSRDVDDPKRDEQPVKLAKSLAAYAAEQPGDRDVRAMASQLAVLALRKELEPTPMVIERKLDTIFRSDLETLHPKLLRLTNDQSHSLERLELNERSVVDGAAGTGKTVLALELAAQHCSAGETVALLCSNPYLSGRFERWAATLPGDSGGRVLAGTPATLPSRVFADDPDRQGRHQRRLEASSGLQDTLKRGYLDHDWGPFLAATIRDLQPGGAVDYLIVDEAQNLCDDMFLDLMDALLKGGLAEGRWTLFGDFTNQDIVCSSLHGGTDALKARGLHWANDRLRTNCRNTEEIAQKVAALVDITSPPMSGVHGPLVQIEYFATPHELAEVIDRLAAGFRHREFYPRQIVLLTSADDDFDTSRAYGGWKLLNMRDADRSVHGGLDDREHVPSVSGDRTPKTVRYSDVYDFQGLESDVVILVLPVTERQSVLAGGVTLPREKLLRRVLYTGMSRAKTLLIILAHDSYRETLDLRQVTHDELSQAES